MRRPRASALVWVAALAAANSTLAPTTLSPSFEPTAFRGTPLPTSDGLIKTLIQDQRSREFNLEPNSCMVFQVSFEGGKRRKFKVNIDDDKKGLAYVVAGVAFYNKHEVFSDPYTLERCDKNFDFDVGGGRQPQCWGPDYYDVDTSGYRKRNECEKEIYPYRMELGDEKKSTFTFRASDHKSCRTESGEYYLYVYANKRTSVSFLVEDGNVKKSSCKNEKVSIILVVILAIVIPIACCLGIIAAIVFCCAASANNMRPENHQPTAYGDAPASYAEQPVQYELPPNGQLAQPVRPAYANGEPVQYGSQFAPPVPQGQVISVVGEAPPSAPPKYGDAPPAYGL